MRYDPKEDNVGRVTMFRDGAPDPIRHTPTYKEKLEADAKSEKARVKRLTRIYMDSGLPHREALALATPKKENFDDDGKTKAISSNLTTLTPGYHVLPNGFDADVFDGPPTSGYMAHGIGFSTKTLHELDAHILETLKGKSVLAEIIESKNQPMTAGAYPAEAVYELPVAQEETINDVEALYKIKAMLVSMEISLGFFCNTVGLDDAVYFPDRFEFEFDAKGDIQIVVYGQTGVGRMSTKEAYRKITEWQKQNKAAQTFGSAHLAIAQRDLKPGEVVTREDIEPIQNWKVGVWR